MKSAIWGIPVWVILAGGIGYMLLKKNKEEAARQRYAAAVSAGTAAGAGPGPTFAPEMLEPSDWQM